MCRHITHVYIYICTHTLHLIIVQRNNQKKIRLTLIVNNQKIEEKIFFK